jgi:hypothetical protein
MPRPPEREPGTFEPAETHREAPANADNPGFAQRHELAPMVLQIDIYRMKRLERAAHAPRRPLPPANGHADFPEGFRQQRGDEIGFSDLDDTSDQRGARDSCHPANMTVPVR